MRVSISAFCCFGSLPKRLQVMMMAATLALCVLGSRPALALRLPAEAEGPRVLVYSLWNQQYLCLAAKVPDTMLTGSSTTPMSAAEQDDAIEFDFEVLGPQGVAAHRLIISTAGGMTIYTRDGRGQWRTDPSWVAGPRTVKFAVTTDGTLNNPNDRDTGYVVECAVPWEFLGGEAPAGREIGFNVTVWMQGENEGIASWSPSVSEPSQVGDAARWGQLAVGGAAGLLKATGMWLPSPLALHMPFIDGKLSAAEWLSAGTLEFTEPEAMIEVSPKPAERTGVVGAVAAVYRYDWQGGADPTAGAPFWRENAPVTSNQPRTGVGPWVSYQRVDWHAQELAEAQRAGIDILLARYSGDERSRRTWARVGLERLAQALKERRAKGLGYPLVGMMLDTAPLNGVDLRTDAGKQQAYGMIREFFLRVPDEFWAEIGAQPEEGLRGGVPVLLGEPDGLAGWDAGFARYCQEEFARDFGGERLVWLGSSAWRTEGLTFYSYIKLPTRSGFTASTLDGATAAVISPGYTPPPGRPGEIRPRMEGKSYRSDWQRALAIKPELVILDSWNDYENGTEIAPSRQYGVIYVDITRLYQSRLGSQEPHSLWLKQQRVPSVIAPGIECQSEFLVENAGVEYIQTGTHLSADYVITRRSDGAVVRKKQAAQALNIAAGQTQRLPVTITTKDDDGKPLPNGDYLFTLTVTRTRLAYMRSSWFAKPVAQLSAPFTVGTLPEQKATVISTSLPAVIPSGGGQNVVVRLRNDGRAAWRPGSILLSYSWVYYADDLPVVGAQPLVIAPNAGQTADIPREVKPGEVVSVMIVVSATGTQGGPLPPSTADDLYHWRVRWELAEGAQPSDSRHRAGEEAVQVVAADPGVVFESAATPAEMGAGQRAEVAVTVANAGNQVWESGQAAIISQWYRWDGRPVSGAGLIVPLPRDVAPGDRLEIMPSLIAPTMAGPYWVTWSLAVNGGHPESTLGTPADLVVTPVVVRSPSVSSINLTEHSNIVGVTVDSYRARGEFDGRGDSLPAEWMPPDQSASGEARYPSGYFAPGAPVSSIPFAYPDISGGVGSVVACNGQKIELGERGVVRIHLVAVSTEGAQTVTFRLGLETGEVEEMAIAVPAWDARAEGAAVAAYTPYLRTLSGDNPSKQAYLYHLILTPRERATSLELPKAPWVKVVAMTVEAP